MENKVRRRIFYIFSAFLAIVSIGVIWSTLEELELYRSGDTIKAAVVSVSDRNGVRVGVIEYEVNSQIYSTSCVYNSYVRPEEKCEVGGHIHLIFMKSNPEISRLSDPKITVRDNLIFVVLIWTAGMIGASFLSWWITANASSRLSSS